MSAWAIAGTVAAVVCVGALLIIGGCALVWAIKGRPNNREDGSK